MNSKKAVIVMIRGLPGSGKSYLAKEIQKQATDNDVVLLDPDATDYNTQEYSIFSSDLTSQGVDEKLHPYRFLRSQAYSALNNHKVVIWNQAFTHQDLLDRTIKNLEAYAEEHEVRTVSIVVEVDISPEFAQERVNDRVKAGGHDVPVEVFQRFINDYKSFTGYGYTIVNVKGDSDVAQSADQVLRVISKLKLE